LVKAAARKKEQLATTSAQAGTSAPDATQAPRARSRKWLVRGGLLVLLGLVATYAALRWQDRPLEQALSALRSGNAKRAAALSDYYLASHPKDERAMALKARALVELGQADEALRLFEETSAADFDELHAWAKAFLIKEQWTRALPLLIQLQKWQPQNADVLHEITTCRIRLGLLAEALETAQKLSDLPGHEARGLVLQAAVHNDLGDYVATIDCYEKLFSYSPDANDLQLPPDEIFMQHGLVLLNAGQPQAAIKSLQRSLAIKPSAVASVGLGKAYHQDGNLEAAAAAWKETLKIDPKNGAARESLANSALQTRDFKAAREWLEPLRDRPEMPSSTAYLFQRIMALNGEKEESALWTKRAEKIREREQIASKIEETLLRAPYAYWTNVVRAHQFAAAGNWAQAEDMMKELTRDAPKDPFIEKLAKAIRDRSELPPLSELPLN